MKRIPSPAGVTVSYDNYGEGPPLVLVHGSFSDHKTNWEFVKPVFETQFMPSPAAAGVKRTRPKVTVWRMGAGMSWR